MAWLLPGRKGTIFINKQVMRRENITGLSGATSIR